MTDGQTSLVPGATLHGTYVLESLLGRGGMGAVWRARHLRLPRPMAIKVLHEHAYESEEILLRFRREAEITSQLGHPHIVEVFDFNVLDDGRAYLVMEHLEGQSLRERLRTGPELSEGETAVIVEQVASALAHAHRAGVVHRDLKPENVFLVAHDGSKPHAKVLDFGISKMQGAHTVLTQGASLMGTPRYMSPEQAKGDTATVDGRADQFSLGAIAYELLAKKPAFEGTTVTEVLLRVLQDEPAPIATLVPNAPPRMATAVTRALARRREDRFDDPEGFLDVWTGEAPPAPRPNSSLHTDPDAVEDTVRRAPLGFSPASQPERRTGGQTRGSRRGVMGLVALLLATSGVVVAGAMVYGERFRTPPALPLRVDGGGDERSETRLPSDAGRIGDERSETGLLSDAGPATSGMLDASPLALDSGGPADAASARDAPGSTGSRDAGSPRIRRAPPPRAMPPRLRGAYRALREEDFDGAVRKARQSLREEGDPRAYAALAIAHCGKRDLGTARAMLRRTPRRHRAAVRRACSKLRMDLTP